MTAFPHAYYPEDSWQDDMELGATELALAGRLLGDSRTRAWARQATHWAREYIASKTRADQRNLRGTVTAPSHNPPESAPFAGT